MRLAWPATLLFLVIASIEIAWGYYAVHVNDYIHGDAISRVANAFYVLYSRDPHLGAIGFIWNPLPSILEMIPLLLWKPLPVMAGSGLASVIVSAAFSAGTAAMLYTRLRCANIPIGYRILLIAGLAGNPFVFMYGANGMSEMMFALSIAWLVFALTDWMRHGHTNSVIQIGLALSLGFWIRYETVSLGVAVAGCIVIVLYEQWRTGRNQPPFKELYAKTESTLLLTLLPPVFSGILWILLNYSIMGDPLYFLRSGYSNTAFVQDRSEQLIEMTGNLIATLDFVLRKMLYFSIPAVAILVSRIVTNRWRQPDMLVFLALVLCVPAMQTAMLYQGSSYGWLRFFFSPLIVAIAWLPYEWKQLEFAARRTAIFTALCVSVLCSSLVVRDMNNQAFAPEEYGSFHMGSSQTARDMRTGKEIARYLDELIESRYPERTLILTDSFSAFSMIVNIRHPGNLVITNDRDFQDALENPHDHGVDYILVSKLEGAVLQVIHQVYPELYDQGMPWTELVRDFNDEWRLYRVLPAAESTAN